MKCWASSKASAAAGAERRQIDLNHVDAEVKVLAEAAFLDGRFQVAVRGGQHARTSNAISFSPPTGRTLAFLQGPQQLGLHGQRHLADLVEKQRAAFGLQKQSLRSAAGVGERAFDVPEKFAFQERVRQRRAIHGDERLLAAAAAAVQRLGDKLLAGAAFAHDEHRGVGIGDLGRTGRRA